MIIHNIYNIIYNIFEMGYVFSFFSEAFALFELLFVSSLSKELKLLSIVFSIVF